MAFTITPEVIRRQVQEGQLADLDQPRTVHVVREGERVWGAWDEVADAEAFVETRERAGSSRL